MLYYLFSIVAFIWILAVPMITLTYVMHDRIIYLELQKQQNNTQTQHPMRNRLKNRTSLDPLLNNDHIYAYAFWQ